MFCIGLLLAERLNNKCARKLLLNQNVNYYTICPGARFEFRRLIFFNIYFSREFFSECLFCFPLEYDFLLLFRARKTNLMQIQ